MPADADSYLHRVGRAGRFGTKGLAISFVSQDVDKEVLKDVGKRFEVAIPYVSPSLPCPSCAPTNMIIVSSLRRVLMPAHTWLLKCLELEAHLPSAKQCGMGLVNLIFEIEVAKPTKNKGLGIPRNHRVGLSAACGLGLSSLACRFVTGEEEKSLFKCFRQGQSESLNKRMILAQNHPFTSVVAMPIYHLR